MAYYTPLTIDTVFIMSNGNAKQTKQSQHSQECNGQRRHCFCD